MEVECTVLIITYNSSEVIEKCISTVLEKNKKRKLEILVIDNHSRDGTAELVKAKFPFVRVIKNNINIGFARAVNQGARLANGKYILLLNPDVFLISEEPVDQMISFMENNPNVGACGRYNGWEGDTKSNYSRRMMALYVKILKCRVKIFLCRLLFAELLSGKICDLVYKWFLLTDRILYPLLPLIEGCFLFTTKKMLLDYPFYEKMFMYFEDFEWGARIAEGGYCHAKLPIEYLHIGWNSTKQFGGRAVGVAGRISIYRWLAREKPLCALLYRFSIFLRIPIYLLLSLSYLIAFKISKSKEYLQEAKHLFLFQYPFPK